MGNDDHDWLFEPDSFRPKGKTSMKIIITGKGGSGKSTISVMLSKVLASAEHPVLLIDGDESNFSLHRLLGAPAPKNLMNEMGGRQGVREKLPRSKAAPSDDKLFGPILTMDDLPTDSVTDHNGIKLLVLGKIEQFGEGCACLISSLSRTVLAKLREDDDAFVIIDAEAGVEHFGRRVDAVCDLIIGVVDPTHESFQMAARMKKMADEAGIPIRYILNKVDDQVGPIMDRQIDTTYVIDRIPNDEMIFSASLKGHPLEITPTLLDGTRTFLKTRPFDRNDIK